MRRTFIVIFLAFLFLALRIEHSTLFYELGRDKRYQMTAAANLVAGKGISHCKTFPDDIAKVSCEELTWWSAGYPVVIAGLYKLTDDLITSDFILIVFGLVLFLFASFRFFSLWFENPFENWSFGAFLLFAGLSFTPFNYFSTNDLVSTSFLLVVLSEASIGFRDRRNAAFVIAGSAAFAAAFFKFSFYPFLAVVPAALFLLSILRRELAPTRYIIYFLLPISIGFLALLAFFPNHVTPPSGEWTQGWNWYNLGSQDPFAAKALFFIDFLLRRLDPGTTNGFTLLGLIQAFSILLVGSAACIAGRYVYLNLDSEREGGRTLSALIGIITVATVVVYLMWLSVRVATFYHPIYQAWTFVQETRYYGPAMVLILFTLFIFPNFIRTERRMLRLASIGLVLAMTLYAVAYWGFKNFDYFYNGRIEGSFEGGHRDDAEVAEFLKNDRSLDRGSTVLGFVSHAGAYRYPILLVKADPQRYPFPWYDWYVGSTAVNTSQPRALLVMIHKSPTVPDLDLLQQYRNSRILQLSTYDLYRVEITP